MYMFVVLFAFFVVVAGLGVVAMLTAVSVLGRDIEYVSYTPRSENEAEYGLRTLLFMYPNAVIDTPHNEISSRLRRKHTRITVHQEL